MYKMTTEAIKKLQTETGHAIVVEDFDLIEELDACAAEFAGVSKSDRRLLNQPYVLCGISFYPLTVAKSLWFAEMCEEWELDGLDQDSFLFWLLSLPNSSDALDHYSNAKKALRAVKRLSRRLHCTQAEMTEVYHKCLGINGSESGEGPSDTDYGGVIAVLLREYGGKPDEWLYETPVEMISTLFTAYANKVNAQNDASNSGGKSKAQTPPHKLAAMSKFRAITNKIREVWNGE